MFSDAGRRCDGGLFLRVQRGERDPDEKDVRNIGGYMHHINLYFEDIVI